MYGELQTDKLAGEERVKNVIKCTDLPAILALSHLETCQSTCWQVFLDSLFLVAN